MPFSALGGLGRRRRQRRAAIAGTGADSSPDEITSAARKKKRKKEHLSTAADVVTGALLGLHASADALPPLKSTLGGLTHIVANLEVCSSFAYSLLIMTDLISENERKRE